MHAGLVATCADPAERIGRSGGHLMGESEKAEEHAASEPDSKAGGEAQQAGPASPDKENAAREDSGPDIKYQG